ncbi:hypothetical protein PV325_011761, partial [Microctonus aethiopoides]
MSPRKKRSRETGAVGPSEEPDMFANALRHLSSVASRHATSEIEPPSDASDLESDASYVNIASGSGVGFNNQSQCCQLDNKMDIVLNEFRKFGDRFTRFEERFTRMEERQERIESSLNKLSRYCQPLSRRRCVIPEGFPLNCIEAVRYFEDATDEDYCAV